MPSRDRGIRLLFDHNLIDRYRDSSYHRRDRDRDRDRSRDRNSSRHRSRDRDYSQLQSRRDRDRGYGRDRDRDELRPSQRASNQMDTQKRETNTNLTSSTPNLSDAQVNAAVIAAMQAAQNIKMDPQPQKKRVSRFSSNLLTKKIYFPQHNFDIDYMAIFNGPARSTLEADTHTTITVGGSATVVTEMDELLHVLVSASDQRSLQEAVNEINDIFSRPDHARRLIAETTRSTDVPKLASVITTINSFERPDVSSYVTETMQIPVPAVPLVKGRGGEHVKKLEEIFNVIIRIQFDSEVDPSSMLRNVSIRGSPEGIEKAKDIIKTMVRTGSADIIRQIQTSRDGFETIPIPKDKVGLIVGTHGATIQELQRRTGTNIHVAKEGDAEHPDIRNVTITGDPEKVREAKKQVLQIADGQLVSIDGDAPPLRLLIPTEKVSYVIGTHGAVVQDIQRKTNTRLHVDKVDAADHPGMRYVTIHGSQQNQEAAQEEVYRVLGTTAGTKEYNEDSFAQDAPSGFVPGIGPFNNIFNASMDLETAQKMFNQQAMNPAFLYAMQQSMAGGQPQNMPDMYGMSGQTGMQPPSQGTSRVSPQVPPQVQSFMPMQGIHQGISQGVQQGSAQSMVPGGSQSNTQSDLQASQLTTSDPKAASNIREGSTHNSDDEDSSPPPGFE